MDSTKRASALYGERLATIKGALGTSGQTRLRAYPAPGTTPSSCRHRSEIYLSFIPRRWASAHEELASVGAPPPHVLGAWTPMFSRMLPTRPLVPTTVRLRASDGLRPTGVPRQAAPRPPGGHRRRLRLSPIRGAVRVRTDGGRRGASRRVASCSGVMRGFFAGGRLLVHALNGMLGVGRDDGACAGDRSGGDGGYRGGFARMGGVCARLSGRPGGRGRGLRPLRMCILAVRTGAFGHVVCDRRGTWPPLRRRNCAGAAPAGVHSGDRWSSTRERGAPSDTLTLRYGQGRRDR